MPLCLVKGIYKIDKTQHISYFVYYKIIIKNWFVLPVYTSCLSTLSVLSFMFFVALHKEKSCWNWCTSRLIVLMRIQCINDSKSYASFSTWIVSSYSLMWVLSLKKQDVMLDVPFSSNLSRNFMPWEWSAKLAPNDTASVLCVSVFNWFLSLSINYSHPLCMPIAISNLLLQKSSFFQMKYRNILFLRCLFFFFYTLSPKLFRSFEMKKNSLFLLEHY